MLDASCHGNTSLLFFLGSLEAEKRARDEGGSGGTKRTKKTEDEAARGRTGEERTGRLGRLVKFIGGGGQRL